MPLPRCLVSAVAAVLLAPLLFAPQHAVAQEEPTSTAYGSVGLRYANWGEAGGNFKTENSLNKTAEFSWSLRKKAFFRARMEQANKRAANTLDKVERYGFDGMFESFAISTEFGQIAGVSSASAELAYQDVGPYSAPYKQFGLFENEGLVQFGLLLVNMQRPIKWRFAEGSCATVSGHCYFTDRETTQELYLAAMRYGTYWRGEPMTLEGWMPDANAVFGLGLARIKPTARAVAGATAATGIPLESRKLNGVGAYVDGTFGMAYRMKRAWVTGEFALGLYYRMQGSIAEFGGKNGLETWSTGHDTDWGPYLRATLAF